MRRIGFAAAAMMVSLTLPALAQTLPPNATPAGPGKVTTTDGMGGSSTQPLSTRDSNITPSDTRSNVAPSLPSPAVGMEGTPRDYLMAARSSLGSGKTGEAQQALEMAETRLLSRSVEVQNAQSPSDQIMVKAISDARHALGDGKVEQSKQIIDMALAPR